MRKACSPWLKSRARKLVLGMGAFRTLGTYVRHWERFADWASSQGLAVYPPEVKVVIKYILELDERGCGLTVITSVRSAARWLGKRIGLPVPDMDDLQIKAVEVDVVERRAQEVREAIALPIDLVRVMECYVVKFSDYKPQVACFVGWLLCMVHASLRFNDACHVKPDSLEMQDTGLYGLAWQTKVERKRRGTGFVIAKTGLVHPEWLDTWFLLLSRACAKGIVIFGCSI